MCSDVILLPSQVGYTYYGCTYYGYTYRDVLLSPSQAGGCTSTLLQAFSHYAAFLPHVCHDMRYEDLRSAQVTR